MAIALGGCMKAPPVAYGITEDTGGHITYVLGAMRALAERVDVARAEIVTRLFNEPGFDPIHGTAFERIDDKLAIIRIDSGNHRYLMKEALAADREAFTAALLARLADPANRPDIIHAHFADAAEVARRVNEAYGIPFVYTAHSLGLDKAEAMPAAPPCRHRIAEEDRAIATSAAVIASSRDECERQLLRYPSTDAGAVHRLRPGVAIQPASDANVGSARRLIAPFLRDPQRPIVLAIARPVFKKNLVGLVEAFGRHPDLRHRANLVLLPGLRSGLKAGEAEQKSVMLDLFDAIDRLGLHGHVAYPARHEIGDVAGLYEIAHRSRGLFANPALTEPYGLTLVEAATYGLPVVATARGGPTDIVAELDHGLLVEPTDPAAIAEAISEILADRLLWQRCSRNALANVKHMEWARYAEGFVAIARDICRKQAPREAPQWLLVSDIDNTLTGCHKGARRLADYLARNPKVGFGVATGRSFVEARRLLRDWRMPNPDALIASVGSEIYWRIGSSYRFDAEFAELIRASWQPEAIDAVLVDVPGLVPQPAIEQRAFKRSYFVGSTAVAGLVRDRLAEAGLAARVTLSHDRLLDILPERAGKHAAAEFVRRKFGLPCERLLVAGDSGNDADLLAGCQRAILVANHHSEVRHLVRHQGVYTSHRSHAAGVLEGTLFHMRKGRRLRAVDVAA